jgi:hypothetical protein
MKTIKIPQSGLTGRALAKAGYCALAISALALAGCGAAAASPSGPAARSVTTTVSQSGRGSIALKPAKASSDSSSSSFQVLSMTFVSDQQGFALGTVKCGSGRCVALLGTVNGGTSWRQLTAPTKRAGAIYDTCPSGRPCVSQVRFATPLIGYAFDPSLFVTTDGGLRWHHVGGLDVSSLEAADGNAVRVDSASLGCSGQQYVVQSAPIGTTTWQTLAAPMTQMICQPVLYRQGEQLVLVAYGNPAGGVRATAEIVRSDDGGARWASGPDTCGGRDGYASDVAVAPPDVLVLLCRHQQPNRAGNFGTAWIRVSTNGGASFGPDRTVPAPRGVPAGQVLRLQIAAASARRLLILVAGQHGNRVLLSKNGGLSWSATLSPGGPGPGGLDTILLVGFEDQVTARVAQGDLVWTTYDGGQHWIADRFPA